MSTQELAILLTAKDTASAVLQQAGVTTGETTAKMKGHFDGLGLAAKAAAGFITGSLVGALADAARLAAEDAASVASLTQAVENSGTAWEDVSGLIEERIKAGQSLAFTDDQTRASLQRLTEATGSVSDALGVQSLAMDIARARHISLEAASVLVGKVMNGNLTPLKKIGITLAEGATATEAFAVMQARYGGQSEAYGKTTSAAIDRTKDAISEWKESMGAALGPAQGMVAMLPGLSVATGALGSVMATMGIPSLGAFKGAMLSAIPAVGGLLLAMLPIILAVGAIALAIVLFKTAWENNWGDIQGTIEAARYAVTGVIGQLGKALGWIGDRAGDLSDTFGRAFQWIMDRARDLWNMLPGFIRDKIGEWTNLGTQAIGNFTRGIDRAGPSLLDEMGGLWDDVQELAGNVVPKLVSTGGDMIAGIGEGMSGMKDWLGGVIGGVGDLIPAGLKIGAAEVEGIGLQIPADLAAGIKKGAGAAATAAAELGAAVRNNLIAQATKSLLGTGAASGGGGRAPAGVPLATSYGGIALTSPATQAYFAGVPSYQHGGGVGQTGLAWLHRGEHVQRAGEGGGLTVNFNGPVFGMLDLEQQIKTVVRRAFPRAVTA